MINAATKIVAEVAVAQFRDLDTTSDDIDVSCVCQCMREWADDILACVVGAEEEEFPAWTILVGTEAILKTIDWEYVAQAVITDLKENEVESWACGECSRYFHATRAIYEERYCCETCWDKAE